MGSAKLLVGNCGTAQGISSELCDGLGGGLGGGREAEEGGIYVYAWLIHFAVLKKLTQHCKAITLQ